MLSNIGNCYFKIGNSDKAIEYLNQAISHSNDPIYKIYLGPYENEEERNQWKKNLNLEIELL